MPQRFLRPGITNSERWNKVDWRAQSFYVRLLTLVDDYGRYDGREAILWGQCFALWNSMHETEHGQVVTISEVVQMVQQLQKAQLIECYQAQGKKVLQITQWQERVREGAKERWPAKPKQTELKVNPQQPAAERSVSLPPSPPPSPPPSYTPTPPSAPEGVCVARQQEQFQTEQTFEWLKSELSAMYRRPTDYRMSYAEQSQLTEIARRPAVKDELKAIKGYRAGLARDKLRFFPQSLTRLIEQWDQTLDRARCGVSSEPMSLAEKEIAAANRALDRLPE